MSMVRVDCRFPKGIILSGSFRAPPTAAYDSAGGHTAPLVPAHLELRPGMNTVDAAALKYWADAGADAGLRFELADDVYVLSDGRPGAPAVHPQNFLERALNDRRVVRAG